MDLNHSPKVIVYLRTFREPWIPDQCERRHCVDPVTTRQFGAALALKVAWIELRIDTFEVYVFVLDL